VRKTIFMVVGTLEVPNHYHIGAANDIECVWIWYEA
jgi:hypothetical protein